jgi:hypothetical protein
LSETRGRDEEAGEIAMSKPCVALRNASAFDVRGGMDEMTRTLRDEGVDIESFLRPRLAECPRSVDAQMREPVPENRPRPIRSELRERCEENARVAAYSDGVNELYRLRQERFANENAAFEGELRRIDRETNEAQKAYEQQVEQDRADYEARMADWRRRVALCESGQTEYCQQK